MNWCYETSELWYWQSVAHFTADAQFPCQDLPHQLMNPSLSSTTLGEDDLSWTWKRSGCACSSACLLFKMTWIVSPIGLLPLSKLGVLTSIVNSSPALVSGALGDCMAWVSAKGNENVLPEWACSGTHFSLPEATVTCTSQRYDHSAFSTMSDTYVTSIDTITRSCASQIATCDAEISK